VSGPDVDAVFGALADGTRRTLLAEVARRGEATPTELAAPRR
jgi:DNA-binding transcriptional ArsR family regulator